MFLLSKYSKSESPKYLCSLWTSITCVIVTQSHITCLCSYCRTKIPSTYITGVFGVGFIHIIFLVFTTDVQLYNLKTRRIYSNAIPYIQKKTSHESHDHPWIDYHQRCYCHDVHLLKMTYFHPPNLNHHRPHIYYQGQSQFT
jgi:hypothetical protein